MQAHPLQHRESHRTSWLSRAVMGVLTLLLSLQLLGVAYHDHDYTDTTSVCATCTFVHDLPPALPETAVAPVAVLALVSYLVAAAVLYTSISQTSYLIPLAQAPPQ